MSRLQVIDPVLLTSILRRVDENVKWQSVSKALDQSGLNEIIYDYDKYLKLSSDSGLKDTFRINLLSRVANFKEKARNREALLSEPCLPPGNREGSGDGMKDLLEIKNVRDFKNSLSDSRFREGADGFRVMGNQLV